MTKEKPNWIWKTVEAFPREQKIVVTTFYRTRGRNKFRKVVDEKHNTDFSRFWPAEL